MSKVVMYKRLCYDRFGKHFNFLYEPAKLVISLNPKAGFSSLMVCSICKKLRTIGNMTEYLKNDDYMCVYILRDPSERFLSGYLNQVVGASSATGHCSSDVSFNRTLTNLTTLKWPWGDIHFMPQTSSNMPIELYDHVIGLKDMFPFLKKVIKERCGEDCEFTISNASTYTTEENKNAGNMCRKDFNEFGIPSKSSFLTEEVRNKIQNFYKKDSEMYEKYVLHKSHE